MATNNPKYDDIWNYLKTHHKCKVAAHPALHRRIIHAVINKKYYDLTEKLANLEAKKYTKLMYTREKNQIIFKLVTYHNFNTLTDKDI